ncbi:hypothetical protein C8Q77DRAFT_350986 [Trametes polyzona]|nr:hypothetical protein C8Q77DRAFT_350986 [Trametes polyzona]
MSTANLACSKSSISRFDIVRRRSYDAQGILYTTSKFVRTLTAIGCLHSLFSMHDIHLMARAPKTGVSVLSRCPPSHRYVRQVPEA